MILYTLDENNNPIPTEDTMMWGEWMETTQEQRVVKKTFFGDPGDDHAIEVSTVFLATDHRYSGYAVSDDPPRPILWETMIFGGKLDQEMDRYCSLEDALEGHEIMCKRVIDTLKK